MARQKFTIEVEYDLDQVKSGEYQLQTLDIIKDIQIKGIAVNHGIEQTNDFNMRLGALLSDHILVDVYGRSLAKPSGFPTEIVMGWIGQYLGMGRIGQWSTLRALKGYIQHAPTPYPLVENEMAALFLSEGHYRDLEREGNEIYSNPNRLPEPAEYLPTLSFTAAKMLVDRFCNQSHDWSMFLYEARKYRESNEEKYTWSIVEAVLTNSYGLTSQEVLKFILPVGNHIRTELEKGEKTDLTVSEETLSLIEKKVSQFNDNANFKQLLRLYHRESLINQNKED